MWLAPSHTYSLSPVSSPGIAPHTHLFQPRQSLLALKHPRNDPTFGLLFWLFLLPWNFLQLGVYMANQFISFRLLFRCYILNRSIQTTNLIWQFIGFQYPDTLTCSTVSFFLNFFSPSALYNFFILRFIVYLPSGGCKLHETMGLSLPWFYFSNKRVVWL